ncbi:MAG: NADH dehydrogenase subunit J [bacterium]|nr:MAG: NADH dehydrogenase subunit J [bacterium]
MAEPWVITDILFLLCSIGAIVLSISVVVTKNPIYSSISLVLSFVPIAIIYILFHAPFVAMIQILVYAGAIMVLFTFVIMMIDLRERDYTIHKSKIYKFLSFIIMGGFLVMLPYMVIQFLPETIYEPKESIVLSHFKSKKEAGDFGSTKRIGELIFGQPNDNPDEANKNTLESMQIISFELASILIMVAIVGAMILARTRRREDR